MIVFIKEDYHLGLASTKHTFRKIEWKLKLTAFILIFQRLCLEEEAKNVLFPSPAESVFS